MSTEDTNIPTSSNSVESDLQETFIAEESTTTTPIADEKFRVFLEDLDSDALSALIIARRDLLGNAAFESEVSTPGSYDALLVELSGAISVEATRSNAGIPQDKTLFDTKLVRNGKTILGTPKANRASGTGEILVGADALAAFAIRDNWMKRIPLYNSGFSIDVTAASLSSLNNFFNKSHDTTNSYGRQFGGLFFYFHDLLIKEAVVDLMLPQIINSTLRNARRNDTLIRNIKLVDLKLILNGLGALMFPDGFLFTHVCSNPTGTCTHHEERLIDINKFARYDFSKLPDECIQHMARQTDITPTLLEQYQAKLGFDGQEIRHSHYGFTMKMPSVGDYLDYGRIYNGELTKNIFTTSPDEIARAVLYSYYEIYTPFIAKLTLYNDDGTADLATTEQNVIAKLLLKLQAEDPKGQLIAKFDDYISRSEIAHISYPATPCPSCSYIPGSGYHTVDPILTFFIQSLTKLSQT